MSILRRKLVKNKYSNQISIPKDYLQNLGWKTGDTLSVEEKRVGLFIRKLISKKGGR